MGPPGPLELAGAPVLTAVRKKGHALRVVFARLLLGDANLADSGQRTEQQGLSATIGFWASTDPHVTVRGMVL